MFSALKNTVVLLLTITILVNCKKDKPEGCWDGSTHIILEHSLDTIKPSDYIMAYPGSWWQYDIGPIDTCKGWIAIKTEIPEEDGACLNVYEDLVYLSKTFYGTIYNGSILKSSYNHQGTNFVELIDTNKSNSKVRWSTGSYPFGHGYDYSGSISIKSEIIEHLDSFSVTGINYYDVIHCRTNYNSYHFKYPGPPPTIRDYYFAKNIGLIQYSSGYLDYNPDITKKLVNHYIAPH